MKTVRLIAITDENTGELGLALRDMPRDETTNAATTGDLVAHDVIEHVNGPAHIGGIDDEIQALGALWYVRGQHGEIRREYSGHYSPAQQVAADITRMFRDHVDGGQYVSVAKRTRPCEADDAFAEILDEAAGDYAGEFDADGVAAARAAWPAYRAACLSGMRTGYRKALARWERFGRYAANSTFWAIADAVRPYLKPEFEGAEYVLAFGNGEARCDESFPDEYA